MWLIWGFVSNLSSSDFVQSTPTGLHYKLYLALRLHTQIRYFWSSPKEREA